MTGTRTRDRRCADRRVAMIADGRLSRARVPTLACAGARHRRPRTRSSLPRRPPRAPRASRTLMPDHTGPRCGSGMGSSRRPVRGMSARRRPMITAVPCRARRSRPTRGHARSGSLHLLLLRLLGRRGLLGCVPGRQERQGIDVPVRVGCSTDAEIHVWLGPLGLTARTDRADDVALAHGRPDRDPDGAEVDERDRPAVLGADRQAQPLMGQLPRVGDDAGRSRANARARRGADVDPAVLAAGVGIALGDERPQHRPVGGPRPSRRARSKHERGEHDEEDRVA
jgi:hypothetical protein